MICELVSTIACRSQSFRVVGTATYSAEAVSLIRDSQPDIALISMHLQDGAFAGLTALRMLHESNVQTRVILLLDKGEPSAIVEAFRNGARGLFSRSSAPAALRKCMSVVYNGQIWASNAQLEYLVEALGQSPVVKTTAYERIAGFSKREEQVAHLIAGGMSNIEVSAALGLSKHTVKNYVFRLFEKLGVSTRIELVLFMLSRPKPCPRNEEKPVRQPVKRQPKSA